ncbi:hypothetical protein [Bradyrhizobium sp. UASWS1016]|jgi:hypothetical protein|nr:hypothetical protein [Bradyrhizobium sp. UASWS1016]
MTEVEREITDGNSASRRSTSSGNAGSLSQSIIFVRQLAEPLARYFWRAD